jgi:hypothetical protein
VATCHCKKAHVSDGKGRRSRTSNIDTGCTCLGSLGSMTIMRIAPLHHCTAKCQIKCSHCHCYYCYPWLHVFCPMTLCQSKLTFSLAHVSDGKGSRSRNSNTDTGCTFLGSLGSMTTNRIDPLHHQVAQGAEASIAIIMVTIVAPLMFAVAVACVLSDDLFPM